jgi:hypothetical protein
MSAFEQWAMSRGLRCFERHGSINGRDVYEDDATDAAWMLWEDVADWAVFLNYSDNRHGSDLSKINETNPKGGPVDRPVGCVPSNEDKP